MFIEADAGPSSKNKNKEQLKFFARVSLVDADNAAHILQNFTTSYHTDKIGEEFLFQRVSSLQNLVISLHYLTYDGSDSDGRYHSAVIPVSRLAENVEISQWYQLFRHGTIDEPGSSIRLQIKYYTRDSDHFTTTSTTIGRTIGNKKTGIALAAAEERSSIAITTGKSSLPAATGASLRDALTTANSSSSSNSSSSNLIDRTTTKHTSIDEQDRNKDEYPPLLRSGLEPWNSNASMSGNKVNPSATTVVTSPQQRADERLVVGIIDYALLFGPMHVNETIRHVAETAASSGHSIPLSSPPLSAPLVSAPSSVLPTCHDGVSSSHVVLWDRFPIDDHEDSPLPPKIEVSLP